MSRQFGTSCPTMLNLGSAICRLLFIFIEIAGCTFIFDIAFNQTSIPKHDALQTLHDILSWPFVFIHIAGCTFILRTEAMSQEFKSLRAAARLPIPNSRRPPTAYCFLPTAHRLPRLH
jgi:hypothetical protein